MTGIFMQLASTNVKVFEDTQSLLQLGMYLEVLAIRLSRRRRHETKHNVQNFSAATAARKKD